MLGTAGAFLLLIAVSQGQLLPPDEVRLGCQSADIGFLLDMSGTARSSIFRRSLKLIQGLVREFHVRPGGSRAGLVTFSDNAKTDMDFDMYPSVHKFNGAVRNLTFTGGRTRIDRGLDEATEVLYNQRFNHISRNQKYLFVISDGKQSKIGYGRHRPNLKARTRLLRHQRVKIIAVAMGETPELFYMNQLVQFPEFEVIHVSYYANLKQKVKQIHHVACSKPPAVPTECEKMADFGFLLDQSSSIGGAKNFKFETDFVKGVLDNVSNVKNKVCAGVILYGVDALLKIKLNEFQQLHKFKAALEERAKFEGSYLTRIDLALDIANKQLFTKENGDRPDIPNYLVLVTDGKQNSGIWDIDQNLVSWFAEPLWRRNITIFAVGVGKAKLSQLREIAGPDGTAIYKSRLNQLNEAVDMIIPQNCRGCHKKVSLGFIVDASGTSRRHYNKMKRLVHHVIEGFKPQKNQSQASVVRFSSEAVVDIHFGQFDELYSFQAEVDTGMPFMGGRTYIHLALQAAGKEFKNNANPRLPKVLIVITDGLQTGRDIKPIREAAEDLRRQGVRVVAVSVGTCKRKTCKKAMAAMAGDAKNIVQFQNRDNILEASEKIATVACPPDTSA